MLASSSKFDIPSFASTRWSQLFISSIFNAIAASSLVLVSLNIFHLLPYLTMPLGNTTKNEAKVIARRETLFTEGRDLKSKKEASPPVENTQNLGFGSSAAVLEDDFRPTTPGYSPGVGHAFPGHHDIDTKSKALENAPGVGHSVAGNTDDFRATMPGHSAGVGHSFPTKIGEPNP
ncbi:unnamed protein product [Ilex paraguariensis]|uniref:Uncharacterized protein n=1 Tax=Ilex paraguariensis TaxID=185542 RepID=A0ABC8TAL9_9AQUA